MDSRTPIVALCAMLAVSTALIGGCAKSGASSSSKVDAAVAAETASWQVLKAKDGSFSVKIPKDWTPVDPQNEAYQKVISQLGDANPQLKQFEQAAKQLSAMAVQINPKQGGYSDNVSLNIMPAAGKTDLTAGDAADIKRQLGAILPLDGEMQTELVSQPAGPTIRYVARLKINMPDGKTIFTHSLGYLVLHSGSMYVVGYTSAPDHAAQIDKIAENSIKTLAFQ